MDEVRTAVLGSRLGLEMGIDVLHESFFAPGTHHEDIILVDLAVQLFLAQAFHFPQEILQFAIVRTFFSVGYDSIKHRPHADGYLVPQVPVGQHASTTMTANPAHGVDITSRCDYK